jgi:Ca2+-binding RTX toxin-like protein
MATYTAAPGGGKVNGTSTADQMVGQGGADTFYAGAGNDILSGGGGRDLLYGQDGNDTLDGNAGGDLVDGGAGTDVLIYRLAENAGMVDAYSGGTGVDTLRLEFTAAEWASATVQAELARYVAHLASVARTNGEVASGTGRDFTFNFGGGTTLGVSMVETLQLSVDGQLVDYNAPRITAHTDPTVGEDAGSGGSLSAQGTIDFSDVDKQQSHTVAVTAVAGNPLGGSVAGVISTAPRATASAA